MNHDQVIGNWKQFKGEAKRQWSRLTEDDLLRIQGHRDKLAGKIQKAYGVAIEQAHKQITRWEEECRKRKAA